MVHRNDGIGGTPRLARYTSIGTPRRTDATPNRPPLPQRTPGETDIGHDPRFRLTAARAVAPAPASALDAELDPGDTVVAQAVRQARLDIAEHLPSARLGECRTCDVAAPCRPLLRSLVILDRWDPGKARRVRAVLQLSGLMPDGYPHGEDDDDV
ncbi:hypothetical protein EDC02_2067 [Micromonospora sp. Llam0]|uniref:hypothetical protein n=1 Tax=Micromonospora sp. Llam0 TaxID=2485143 RepID=UPI000F4702DE|nr:hypothetical protein [Micromonospora sp. Llam0]ROO60209.1 hypothetical protein EDC02_2067 [Micromonospora sp. Llam0]